MPRSILPYVFGGPSSMSLSPFAQLQRDMTRMFDEMMRGFPSPLMGTDVFSAMTPRIDVSETDNEICIQAELPGVSEKDIRVDLDEDILTIHGEKKHEREEKKENYFVKERSEGAFTRSIRLPYAVKPNDVRASFENGVLTVLLPKAAATEQNVHRIPVQAGGSQQRGAMSGSRVDRAAAGDKPGEATQQSGGPAK